jgi:hypothetical protein
MKVCFMQSTMPSVPVRAASRERGTGAGRTDLDGTHGMEVADAHVYLAEQCLHVEDMGEQRVASCQVDAADLCADDLRQSNGRQEVHDVMCAYTSHMSLSARLRAQVPSLTTSLPILLPGAARHELVLGYRPETCLASVLPLPACLQTTAR